MSPRTYKFPTKRQRLTEARARTNEPVQGPGDPSHVGTDICGRAPIHLGMNRPDGTPHPTYVGRGYAARQLTLYAASIGQRRGLLPLDLTHWRLAWREGCTVCFEQVDAARAQCGRTLVIGRVTFELSRAALFDWPAPPVDESEPERVAA